MYRIDFKSVLEATQTVGEKELLNIINKSLANLNYRAKYNKTKNEVLKRVKNDPRFQDLMTKATKEVRKS